MPPTKQIPAGLPCPCGSKLNLATCCLPYIEGKQQAPTAEALMRSRYTAHALVATDYLWNTWSPATRIRSTKTEIEDWANSCEWLGLQIVSTQAGQVQDYDGVVSFIAIYRQNNQLKQHKEISIFEKVGSQWFYRDHQ